MLHRNLENISLQESKNILRTKRSTQHHCFRSLAALLRWCWAQDFSESL